MTTYATKDTSTPSQDSYTRFYALSDHEENGMRAAAHVDLRHEKEIPNFVAAHDVSIRQPSEELFRNKPGEVHGAFTDPTMRSHLPTLLGMAAETNMRETGGRLPQPAKSLSAQSSGMVRKLIARGVPIPENHENPTAAANNALRMKDYMVTDNDTWDAKFADPARVKSGRDLVRGMLRSPKVNSNQFGSTQSDGTEQGKLF